MGKKRKNKNKAKKVTQRNVIQCNALQSMRKEKNLKKKQKITQKRVQAIESNKYILDALNARQNKKK